MSTAAPVPWSPPSLRGLSTDAIGLWNALVSHLGHPLPLRGQVVAVATLAAAPPEEADCLDLRFSDGPDLILRPVAFPFASAFEADLTVDDFPLLPEALRHGLQAGLVAILAATLPDHGLGGVSIVGTGPLADLRSPDAASALRWFDVTSGSPGAEPTRVEVGLGLAALARVFGDGLPGRPVWPALRTLLTRTVFRTLGRLILPWAELRRLEAGTVVVLESGLGGDVAQLRVGHDLIRFDTAGEVSTCTAITAAQAPQNGRSQTMPLPVPQEPEGSDAQGDAPTRNGAEHLDIALDLDLGSLTVPLAEIETWQVGSVVPLRLDPPREGVEVVLRANGLAVGTGELVRIDDRLAVRLTRLSLA